MANNQHILSQKKANNHLVFWCVMVILTVSITTIVWFFNSCCSLSGNISMIINIIGSLLGVFAAFLLLQPRFDIGELVIEADSRLHIIVRNKQHLIELLNIRVELDFCQDNKLLKDKIAWPIIIDYGEMSVMYGKRCGIEDSSQIVHSKNGFTWDPRFEYIRCRVSATHAISGITHVKETTFRRDDIYYGTFVGGNFMGLHDFYYHNSTLIDYATEIMNCQQRVLTAALTLPKSDYNLIWVDQALSAINHMIARVNLQFFEDASSVIDKLKNDLIEYKDLYRMNIIIPPDIREERNNLSQKIRSSIQYLSFYANEELIQKLK